MSPNEKQKRWLKKRLPKGAVPLDVVPRAYCIAKPAPGCAVFELPVEDLRKHLTAKESRMYHHGVVIHSVESDNILEIHQGEWATLVYATTPESGMWYCVVPLIPFSVFDKESAKKKGA